MNPASTDITRSLRQVEPNEDDETNSGRQGRKGSAELLRARSDRVNFEIFMTVVESRLRLKRELPSIQFQFFTRRRKWQIFANGS
jgi:hypothetical protein